MRRPSRLVLLGHPVAHSLSPRFQQAALDACGIPLRYEALDVLSERFVETFNRLATEGAAGNVTLPHKQQAAHHCALLTDVARRAAAVNTFWCDADGRVHGDNTDVGGFVAAVDAMMGAVPRGLRVLLLGNGGAALAVREAVAAWPEATLTVAARDAARGQVFAAHLGSRARVVTLDEPALSAAAADADLIVNATPLGLHNGDPLPLPVEWLSAHHAVFDLTYRRDGVTPWVRAARERGLRADDGLGMLVEQGALAFERWFGIEAPRAVMRAAVESR